jgi:hypothetical protein
MRARQSVLLRVGSRKYETLKHGHLPRFGFAISRADVADFMIKAGENGVSIGKVVGVSN